MLTKQPIRAKVTVVCNRKKLRNSAGLAFNIFSTRVEVLANKRKSF